MRAGKWYELFTYNLVWPDGKVTTFSGKKTFYAQFPDKMKEMQKYASVNDLNFRKDSDNSFKKLVEFYNSQAAE